MKGFHQPFRHERFLAGSFVGTPFDCNKREGHDVCSRAVSCDMRNPWALQALFPNCWVPRRIELVQRYPGVPQQKLLLIQETYFGMRKRVLCYIAHINSRAMPQQRCKHFLWMILGCWPNRLTDLFQERL